MCSPPESWPLALIRACERARAPTVFVALALLLGLWPAQAIDRLSLRVAEVSNPAFALEDIQVAFETGSGEAIVSVARLRAGERVLRDLRLRCPRAMLSADGFMCRDASLQFGNQRFPALLDLQINLGSGRAELVASFGDGGRVGLILDGDGNARADLIDLSAQGLQALLWAGLPAIARDLGNLSPVGRASGQVEWAAAGRESPRIVARLRLSGAGFGTSDGLRAAEGVAMKVAVDATRAARDWVWEASLDWDEGAAYVHPIFIEAGPRFSARGRIEGARITIERAEAVLEGVGRLHARGRMRVDALEHANLELELGHGDLALIGPRWLAPLLLPASADRLRFAGHVSGALRVQAGRLQAVQLTLDDAGVSLAGVGEGAGLALGPIDGEVSWAEAARTRSRLEVSGGQWEKLTLGAFVVDAELSGNGARLERTVVPVLDGAVVLDDLSLSHGAGGWLGSGSVVVEPVSIPALTAALGLPRMSGVLSASLPGLRVSPGEIALDGALVISVFDGYLQATGLRLREPFGVASHLSADIEARHIDLAQLTETFSFGNITGFVDADVRGLELARWRPVGFDARVSSSPGDYRRRISQRAVENIGAVGGAGALVAIQRSLLQVFDTFGYREIGVRCRLAGGVCLMDGIDGGSRADDGFVIVRGGGVPALDVIGYNRRVDWDELLDRLQRVIADNVSPELR